MDVQDVQDGKVYIKKILFIQLYTAVEGIGVLGFGLWRELRESKSRITVFCVM